MVDGEGKPSPSVCSNNFLADELPVCLPDFDDEESTVRRKPCTLGESGFLRTPSCFEVDFMFATRSL